MWRETKILLIDDDAARRRDLSVIFTFLGEELICCDSGSWQAHCDGQESLRGLLCVLLGTLERKGGALELLKELGERDEFLPVLLLGEQVPGDWPEDYRRRVLASLDMPPGYNQLLDSLHRAQVYRELYD